MKIKKAVIPVAGKGTRMLPVTKAVSKELMPILTMPMIHYVLEEALNAGISEIVFITSYGKEDIVRFYSRNVELEVFLEKNGKFKELELVKKMGEMIEVIAINQKEQLGLGHAILQAQKVVGDENFAVLLGDEIISSKKSVITQMADSLPNQKDASVIAVMEVAQNQTSKYGIVDGQYLDQAQKLLKIKRMVEKPKPELAPSNLACPGRYIFTPEIFDCLKKINRGAGGEYQLTDAIDMLAQTQAVFAYKYEGERFDTGNIVGYFDATVEYALRNSEIKEDVIEVLKKRLKAHGVEI